MEKSLVLISILIIASVVFAEEQQKEIDYRTVIVDAQLVRVSAEALYDDGTKAICQKKQDIISVLDLVRCLADPNSAEVVASAATKSKFVDEARCLFNKGSSIKSQQGTAGTVLSYEQKVEFNVCAYDAKDDSVMINGRFIAELISDSDCATCPPDNIYVYTQIRDVIHCQKPTIVYQSRIGNDMFFLVLRTEIIE